jgi:pseudouridine-5'-phosphate glycosidase
MMHEKLPDSFMLSSEILRARALGLPVVALESTVITHGLPYPENLELARQMESEVRDLGSVPATIAVLDGKICIGLNTNQLERLAGEQDMLKISTRDFGPALARGKSGGTTVSGTSFAAHLAGIRVFATGGIGGVHRNAPFDVSADLDALSRFPVLVVCAGAKAILDLPATLEKLETLGVPVVGYQTNEFPAFYSRSSGHKLSTRADDPQTVAAIARSHWDLGLSSAMLLVVPPPEDTALGRDEVEGAIEQAIAELGDRISGQAVTPFLLSRVSELTRGASLQANLSLLKNNARVAAQVARYLNPTRRQAHV